jgi:hypothetical protein
MNLYKFHEKPSSVDHNATALDNVPKLVWEKPQSKDERKAREDIWAKDARCAYFYARYVLKDRFEKGEDAIATDAHYAFMYATNVTRGRFEKGEDAITKSHLRREYELTFKIKL